MIVYRSPWPLELLWWRLLCWIEGTAQRQPLHVDPPVGRVFRPAETHGPQGAPFQRAEVRKSRTLFPYGAGPGRRLGS